MTFLVSNWTVEPALNQLTAASKTVNIEPKAMAVLVYLADRPGQVVSRDALLSAIWSGLVVSDDSLTQVVIKLRKALGDTPRKPVYIQTIAKGGYRLIAPVVKSAGLSAAPLSTSSESWFSKHKTHAAVIAGTGAAALLIAGAGVWRFQGGSVSDQRLEQAVVAGAKSAAKLQPTVVIRLFDALGDDRRVKLLARGITEDLVTDLSRVSGLTIIRETTLNDRPETQASEPTSDYVVSGNVQRADRRLRIQVYLIDARTRRQLWAERFDRPVTDLFAIQEELGPKILRLLPAKVDQAELQRIAKRYTYSLDAYEDFHLGQAALLVRRRVENGVARDMFRRAINLDPAFARAYAGLALTYAADHRNQWSNDGDRALLRALELAQTADQISPGVPETYWTLAFVNVEWRRHEQALQYLNTAVQLNPSFADAYALMGGIYTYLGRPADSVALLRTAMRLNPEAGSLYFLLLGRAYLFLGDLEQAQLNLEQALLRNNANLETHVYAAVLHLMAGNREAAEREADEIRMLQPAFSSGRWLETYPMTDVTQKAKLVRALGDLAL